MNNLLEKAIKFADNNLVGTSCDYPKLSEYVNTFACSLELKKSILFHIGSTRTCAVAYDTDFITKNDTLTIKREELTWHI